VLQHPAGVLTIVAVLAVMMAGAFGAFDIRLPSGLMGRMGGRRGALGAIVMGLVMGLVASPCVGPFLIALIAFVASKGSVLLGAVSFFAAGLGLGLPYLFLGTFTGLVNRFPRGGGWLIWTKRLLGMTMAGLILYYLEPYISSDLFWPLVLAIFIFAAAYLGLLEGLSRRPFSRTFWTVRLATGAAVLVMGGLVYAHATAPHPEVKWTPWTPGALEAARDEKKPVVLYFGADWCIACKEWHATVFTDPAVVRASEPLTRIYADVTRPSDPVRAFAERFQAINPPAVFLIGADGKVRKAYRNPPAAADFAQAMREASSP
jgi:thiol:disulfide interchange protein DsbD